MKRDLKRTIQSHLPLREPIALRSEADFYGIGQLIAEKLGKRRAPRSRTAWQHGWVIDPVTDPRQIIGDHPRNHRILVSNRSIADYLRQHGIDAIPVGLPFAYSDDVDVPRLPNSLLVMPAHVTKHSEHSVDENAYVNFIAEQAIGFDHVLVCVSQQCADRGFWVDAFADHGLDYVVGAGINDRNALQRLKCLLSQFQTMTTNAVGSHSLYAGFCGCRVSLSGPEHVISRHDLVKEPFYQQHPDLVDSVLERSSRVSLVERYPHLDRLPRDAIACQDWARETIGADCCRQPKEIANLLRWGTMERFRLRAVEVIRKNLPKRAA